MNVKRTELDLDELEFRIQQLAALIIKKRIDKICNRKFAFLKLFRYRRLLAKLRELMGE